MAKTKLPTKVLRFMRAVDNLPKAKASVIKELGKAEGTYLGRGASRITFKISGYAVKVLCPKPGWGVTYGDQNEQEAEAWSVIRKNRKVAVNFAPVLATSKRCLVMPLAVTDGDKDFKDDACDVVEKVLKNITRSLNGVKDACVSYADAAMGDLHEGNIGFINGKAVCIDYGI